MGNWFQIRLVAQILILAIRLPVTVNRRWRRGQIVRLFCNNVFHYSMVYCYIKSHCSKPYQYHTDCGIQSLNCLEEVRDTNCPERPEASRKVGNVTQRLKSRGVNSSGRMVGALDSTAMKDVTNLIV